MGSRYLVVGAGGREHALARKLADDGVVFVAPGNAGIAADPAIAGCVAIKVDDLEGLAAWAEEHAITLTVVGPEAPLAAGVVDVFEARGLSILGPDAYCAQLESSKVFAKSVMVEAGVATARFEVFEDFRQAEVFVSKARHPLVIKADGLAGGKGTVVSADVCESRAVLHDFMVKQKFGVAAQRVLVEEFLRGKELSFMVLADGKDVFPLATSQDHKRLADGDVGPNTGGMGALVPAPGVSAALASQILEEIVRPVLRALEARGHVYRGFLYAGVMVTDAGPQVLEFNVRLGDPEAQALLFGMQARLGPVLEAAARGAGRDFGDFRPACAVVLAAAGYPESPVLGSAIAWGEALPETIVYSAGVASRGGALVVGGGRVVTVVARGDDLEEAVARAYERANSLRFEGQQMRSDLGRQRFDHSHE